MTPDELFTRVHRQRTDLIAMRLAMEDLASCLPGDIQAAWLTVHQSRIDAGRALIAKTDRSHVENMKAVMDAQERVHQSLEEAVRRGAGGAG